MKTAPRHLLVLSCILAAGIWSCYEWFGPERDSKAAPAVANGQRTGTISTLPKTGSSEPKASVPGLISGTSSRTSSVKSAVETGDWRRVEALWQECLQEQNRDSRSNQLVEVIILAASTKPDLALRLVKGLELGGIRESAYRALIRGLPLNDLLEFYRTGQLVQDAEDRSFIAHELRVRKESFGDMLAVAESFRNAEFGMFALESAAVKVRTLTELSELVNLSNRMDGNTSQLLRGAVFHLHLLGDKINFAELAQNTEMPPPVRNEAAKVHGRILASSSREQAIEYGISQLSTDAGREVLKSVYPLWLNDSSNAASAWLNSIDDANVLKLLIPEMVRYCDSHNLRDEARAWQAKLNQLILSYKGE